jgi:transcriptional regulator with XRE-family HTH domain
MAPPKTRPEPNRSDPLSEPTMRRRLWAAYLRAGFNRAQFARALGVRYATVQGWDNETATPDLETFARAAKLVEFTLDELMYGPSRAKASRLEVELARDAIKELLVELDATDTQRVALGEHEMSPAGRYQRFTRTYITAFVAAYDAHTQEGRKHDDAIARAMVEATRERALADAVARGIKPVSGEALEAINAPRRTGKIKRPKNP